MKLSNSQPIAARSFNVNGVERTYLISSPNNPSAIVVVFHGNGGTAEGFAKKYALENVFTDTVIIYLQGIPGIGGGFDPKGLKNGWQRKPGDGNDRDLYAIDELIKLLHQQYPTLKNNIYAMGHSNGARFTYLLWHLRSKLFAGFIINAHQAADLFDKEIPIKSAFISTGIKDNVVNNANQLKTAELIKSKLGLSITEKVDDTFTIYKNPASEIKLYHFLHGGGHDLPKTVLKHIHQAISNNFL